MATTIYPEKTRTFLRSPTIRTGAHDMKSTNAISNPMWVYTDTDVEKQFGRKNDDPDPLVPCTWYSERITNTVSIAGEITVNIATDTTAGITARLRFTLSKLSAGGSNIETLICEHLSTTNIVTGLGQSNIFNVTPPSAVTVSIGERFIYRAYAVPVDGAFVVDGTIQHRNSTTTPFSSIVFSETVTFLANGRNGYMSDAQDTGIGVFRDLVTLRDSFLSFITVFSPSEAGGGELLFSRGELSAVSIDAAAIASTTNDAVYASASFTPVANRLYLLGVVHSDAAPETTVPTVATTTGLAFVQVGSSMPFSTIASPGLRLTLFRAMKGTGLAAGTYTVTFGDNSTGCAARLIEVSNVVMTGTDGANAILNVSTNSNNASANPSVTLGAFNDADNGTILFVGCNIATVPTGGTGMTVLGHSTYSTPTGAVAAAWTSANDTTPDLVLASSAWAAIAVELVEVPGGTMEWISPRFGAPGWTFDDEAFVTPQFWFDADATAVVADNMGGAVKMFRRKPDGTELLVCTWTTTTGVPAAGLRIQLVSGVLSNATFVLHQATNFAEDDRMVVRPHRTPVGGTMVAGHVLEFRYAEDSTSSGDSLLHIWDPPPMKAEADPDADPSALPSRLPMMGA